MRKTCSLLPLLLALTFVGTGCKPSDEEAGDSANVAAQASGPADDAGAEKRGPRNKGKKNRKRKNKKRRNRDREPDPTLDAFADQVEKLVEAGDIAGLEALWLTRADLEGCRVDVDDVDADGAAEFALQQKSDFLALAKKELAPGELGDKLFTNRRAGKKAGYMKGVLTGDACQVSYAGRVNVVLKSPSDASTVIQHRFNAQRVGDEWRLYRYLPNRPDCTASDAKQHIGCRKLLASKSDAP